MGIPNGDSIFSKKLRVWCRGASALGATAATPNLHILCNPFAALANDLNVVSVTPNVNVLPATLTGGVATNSPFSSSDFSTIGVQGRLVSAMLRVKYTGTALNAGGGHYGMQEPTHDGIQGKDETYFLGTTCSTQRSISAGEPWFEVTYRPVDHNDTSWINAVARTDAFTYKLQSDGATVSDGAYPFMATITKGAAISQTMLWEFFAVIELAGPKVTGKTLTPPDLQGWATVIAAHSQFDEMAAQTSTREAAAQSNYVSEAIKSYATQMLRATAPYIKAAAVQAGNHLLNRYSNRRLLRAA